VSFSKSSRLKPDLVNNALAGYAFRERVLVNRDHARSVDRFTHQGCMSAANVGGRATSTSSRPGFHRAGPGAFVPQSFAVVASGGASCWRASAAFVGLAS
jgi:hypothetical protein